MDFVGWMYDIAREQSPREDAVVEMLARSQAAGYNAVGLYLEHRFAYPSAPWAAAPGALTPEVVKRLSAAARQRGLRLIPFLNTLGHMEGFIRSEGGQWLAEGPSDWTGGIQMCPGRPECVSFVHGLIDDVLAAFDDEWVHLGGDETRQLGQCARCAARAERVGKGGLYGEHYAALCRYVLERGRRPCIWGDMLIEHPDVLAALPRETVIFDWHYFSRPRESTEMFRRRGFDVVCCPSVQSYNAVWCLLGETRRNIDEHAEDARALGALGVLVTTWEHSFFTQYAATLPIVYAAGRRLAHGADWRAALVAESDAGFAAAAELLGERIPAASEFLRPGTWRQLRDRFVLRQNPFFLWRDWRDEACGAVGDAMFRLCDEAADHLRGDSPLLFAVELHRVAVEWVRLAEQAYRAYAADERSVCIAALERAIPVLERLRPGLERASAAGGSAADVERLTLLESKIVAAAARVAALPRGGAYRPAFEALVQDAYVPGDQAAWRTGTSH